MRSQALCHGSGECAMRHYARQHDPLHVRFSVPDPDNKRAIHRGVRRARRRRCPLDRACVACVGLGSGARSGHERAIADPRARSAAAWRTAKRAPTSSLPREHESQRACSPHEPPDRTARPEVVRDLAVRVPVRHDRFRGVVVCGLGAADCTNGAVKDGPRQQPAMYRCDC